MTLVELKSLNEKVRYKYSNISLLRLSTVKEPLQLLYMKMANYFDITIVFGGRTEEEQYNLFLDGLSTFDGKTDKSKHQKGEAIDAVVYFNDGTNMYDDKDEDNLWRWGYFNGFLKAMALELGIRIKTGSKWREEPMDAIHRPLRTNTLIDHNHTELI
jgi:hypothetical protein